MTRTADQRTRLYKARRPDGEIAWVDHDELWRLQREQTEALRRGRRRRRGWALLALAGAGGLALVLALARPWATSGSPAPGREGQRTDSMAAAGDSATPRAAVAPPAATSTLGDPTARGAAGVAPTAAEPPPPPVDRTARAAAAVRRWAAAWERQDVAAYLASYAAGFEPADGLARPAWERQRRRRLLAPASIRVEIDGLEIELLPEGRAEARFRQAYDSPDYSDQVRKSLLLVEEEGEWRIVAERATARSG